MRGLNTIHDYLRQGLDIREIEQSLSHGEWPQMICDLTGSQKAAFVAQLLQKSKTGLILT
jgi:transcription-repair coupling factor (superfamily II helicase)